MKIGELVLHRKNLKTFIEKGIILPSKVSYAINKNYNKITQVLKEYDEEYVKLFKSYGKKDSDGELIILEDGQCTIDTEYIGTFNSEHNDLLNIELEESECKFHMISIDSLTCEISSLDLMLIDFIIKDED